MEAICLLYYQVTHAHLCPFAHVQAEQLECYEFLDLSDVDDRERNQLATTLYARDEGGAADVDDNEDQRRNDTPTATGRDQQQQQQEDDENCAHYWRNGGGGNSKYQQHPGFATKQHPQSRRGGPLTTRDYPSAHEEDTNSSVGGGVGQTGYQSDSRPVSRTESVLTDISSSYLSSSASSLHVPNNAQQYPLSVTSPPLIINTVVCNGSGQSWPAEGAGGGLVASGPRHPGAYGELGLVLRMRFSVLFLGQDVGNDCGGL